MPPPPRSLPNPDEWSRHDRALRSLARELVRGPQDREDLVQDTFALALSRPPRVLSWRWLAVALRNRAHDLGRSRARRSSQVELADDGPTDREGRDAATIAARLELHEELSRALRDLAEPYRSTIFRRYFDDVGPAEIAARDGVPVKTVKTRLLRGLALLRERLARRHGEDLRGLLPLLLPAPAVPPLVHAAPTSATALGGFTMAKKPVWIAVAACLLLGGTWFLLRTSPTAGEPTERTSSAAVAAPARDTRDADATMPPPSAEPTARHAIAPAARTGALRVRVAWADGTAATGVRVDLRRRHATARVPATAIGTTTCDEHGVAAFAALDPGPVSIRSARDSHLDAEVVVGEERTVELQLPVGVAVRGRVRDAAGLPVANAEIWLMSRYGPYDWLGMSLLARSDADGSFAARDVPEWLSLGATADGHRRSDLVDLDLVDRRHPPIAVELVLAAGGAGLCGTVLDADGRAIADAVLACGFAGAHPFPRKDGTMAEPWAPRTCRSDADGRFALLGLDPGVTALSARAAGFATFRTDVELTAGAPQQCVVRLQRGAVVEGTVVDEQRRPLALAPVRAFAAARPRSFLQMGQYDDPDLFGSPFTLTDAEGRYRLVDVPPGEVHAYASPPRTADAYLRSEPHAEAVLTATAGGVTHWDAAILPGPTIHGHVRFADGTPMANTYVHLREQAAADESRLSACTDADGAFAFYGLAVGPHHVRVQLTAPPRSAMPLERDDVWPDGPDLELTADFAGRDEQGRGEVTARIADPHARAQGLFTASLAEQDGLVHFADERRKDVVLFRGLPAGRYRVIASIGETPVAAGEWFDLQRDEHHDAGNVEIPAAVRLTLHLQRDAAMRGAEVNGYLHVTALGGGPSLAIGAIDDFTCECTAGEHVLRLWARGSAQVVRRFTLTADTRLDLRLVAGVWRPVEIDWPDDHSGARLHVDVVDAAGAVWEDTDIELRYAQRPLTSGALLPPGSYVLTATTPDGLSARATIEFDTMDQVVPTPRILLR